jgi:cytochrome b subunit of formate dehydrogenase
MNFSAKLSYGVLCVAGVILAITGIGTFAVGKPPMTHWVLMAHVAVAPLFSLGLAGLALTWSGCVGRGAESRPNTCARMLFWLILLCGVVVLLSGVLPMTPLLGTRGQRLLYLTHRYSAIVLTAAFLIQVPALLRRA